MSSQRRQSPPSGRSEILRRGFVLAKILFKEIEASRTLSSHQFDRFQQFVRELIAEFSKKPVHPNFLLSDTDEEADWIYNDAVNTALLVFWYCNESRMSATETFEFTLGGLLHDIGQTHSDQVILHSRSRLNEDTILAMHMHPQSGYNLLKSVEGVPESVMQAVLFHHERYDDEGYPTTLPYERLPLSLKIVGVADAFEAMFSARPYRKRLGAHEALRQLVGMAGHNFEFDIVQTFVRLLGPALCEDLPFYKAGQFARTNKGELGQVLAIGEDWLRPRMRLVVDAKRQVLPAPVELNLSESADRHLVRIFTAPESQKIVATLRAKQSAAG